WPIVPAPAPRPCWTARARPSWWPWPAPTRRWGKPAGRCNCWPTVWWPWRSWTTSPMRPYAARSKKRAEALATAGVVYPRGQRGTTRDFASWLQELVDVHYPQAETIRLVVDNLNTHTPAALYEVFAPEEAHRLARRVEFHYTPKHGSWLNMVEIELSVLASTC